MEVIGREKEKRQFARMLTSGKPEFAVVFGRRRVGKTFLIRQYLATNIVFDFSGTFNASMKIQLQKFFDVYLACTQGKKETTIPVDWHQAFKYLANYLAGFQKRKKKVVVFLDEMPWMNTQRSGFLEALEYFWNQHASQMPNVLLVACGSVTSWMQKKLLQAHGGLHNRVTHRIHLKPFTLAETETFCLHIKLKLTRYQILQIYMAMGGIPFYLDELERGKSATQLIDKICFNEDGLLYSEYNYLFASLFKNPDSHVSAIETLAAHPQGLTRGDIQKHSKLPEGGTLNRVLDELELSGFISKHRPFLNKKKETIYKLADMYSLFYLKFIKPAKPTTGNTWQTLITSSTYLAWSGYAFENICIQHIGQIKKALGIGGINTQSAAWKFTGSDELPGAQIDMIIDRADQVINLCEAKFTTQEFAISKDYVQKLRTKRAIFGQVTKTKKSVFTTLLTTFPAFQNKYYFDEIQSEVTMDALFEEI